MKKKVFTSIMICVVLVSILGACGAQEINSRADNAETKQTENKEQENEGLADTLIEEKEQVLTLEAKHIFYTTSGEFESSQETEYDAIGNPIWKKLVQDMGVQSSLAVGEERQQDLRETEYTYEYEYDGNNIVQYVVCNSNGESSRGEREYDEIDNLIKESFYDSDDNLIYEYVFKYDTLGNLVYEDYYTAEGRVSWKEWVYDDKGNMLKHIEYIDPKLYGLSTTLSAIITQAEECEYDDLGNLIKEMQYSENMSDGTKQISYWREYEYDTSNNRIKEMKYTAEGFMTEWTNSEYDEAGNAVKTTVYNSDDSMMYWSEMDYDTNGNMTKQIRYGTDGSVSFSLQYRYEYDSFGNKNKYIEYGSNGDVTHQEEWKYDENSNLTEYIKYSGGGVMLEQIEYVTVIVE